MTLMELFDFDQADLEANHHGDLSSRQQARLGKMYAKRKRLGSAGMIVVLLIAALVLAGGSFYFFPTGVAGLPPAAIAGFEIAFAAVLLLILAGNRRRTSRELESLAAVIQAGHVERIQGPVQAGEAVRQSFSSAYPYQDGAGGYQVILGGHSLLFDSRKMDMIESVLVQGRSYTAYCIDLEGRKYLLSIEAD
jgi:hypothetical protein